MAKLSLHVMPTPLLSVEIDDIYPLYSVGVLVTVVRKGSTPRSGCQRSVPEHQAIGEAEQGLEINSTVHELHQGAAIW